LALFTNTDYKFQLSVEPLVEGYYALAAASPASDNQHRALSDRRPVSYATIPGKPEMLVSCAHLDGTVKYSRISSDTVSSTSEALQRTALAGAITPASHSTSMTNAHASAVVGAMTSNRHVSASTAASGQQQTRSFAGLFGVGSTSSAEDSRKANSSNQSSESMKDGMSDISAPPSVYIPLAARLLDAVNAPTCLYLSDQQTCVTVSENGFYAVTGSAQGAVTVLCTERLPNDIGASSAIVGSDAGGKSVAATVPALFAAGLADPMNTDIGHTSMAAYSSGDVGASAGNSNGDGWVVNHVLHGHDAVVLDVAISCDNDIVASASADGTVILWTGRSGRYLRTLAPVSPANSHPDDCIPTIPNHHQRYSRIERVFISAEALVLCYSVSGSIESSGNCDRLDPVRTAGQYHPDLVPRQVLESDSTNLSADSQGIYVNSQRDDNAVSDEHVADIDEGASEVAALHVYGINGHHLRTRRLVRHLRDIALTRDGKYGACVSLDSRVAVFDTHTLGVVRQFELPACGCSVAWSGASERQLIVGCEGGRIVVISADLSLVH
ncbi:Neurobeachin-like protein 1, partial [Coemansia furcata]